MEIHTGSLGHGLSIGAGHALFSKIKQARLEDSNFASDGECHEGSIWEGAMFAGHHQLSNLIAIVDRNGQCCDEFTEKCLKLEPLADKLKVSIGAFITQTVMTLNHYMRLSQKLLKIHQDFQNDYCRDS